MDLEVLEDLGLTKSEIKTYMTLLEIGSTTAGTILEKSGLQNSVMHRALNSLIEKGIVNYVLEGRRKLYQASEPEYFNKFIDEKKRKFNDILPELKKREGFAIKNESATIYKGKRGISEVYHKLISLNAKEYITFGGGEEVAKFMGMPWWLNLHAKRVENKLPSRQVFDETVRVPGKDILSKKLTNVRFLSKEFAQFQETVIVGEYVAVNVFSEEGYSFLIKDKKVAEGYMKYFELLWKIAKP
jgi:sugar-specific transcriptional regulator TrmB